MSETNMPIDQAPSAREFLNLDAASPAPSPSAIDDFEKDFNQSAGVMSNEMVDKLNTYRSEARAERAKHRPSRARVFAGGVATGAVLSVAAANGMFDEAGDAQKLAEHDKQNQQQNIANNPELFGGDTTPLPENPADMTVTVEAQSVSPAASEADLPPAEVSPEALVIERSSDN